jgi:glycosyltransferase involved in cell wall biosynthesis
MGLRILTLFRDLTYFDPVYPQFKAIADNVEKFTVVYTQGSPEPGYTGLDFKKLKTLNSPSVILDAINSRGNYAEIAEQTETNIFYALSDGWMQEYTRYGSEKLDKPMAIKVRGDHREIDQRLNKNKVYQRFLDYVRRRSFRQTDSIIPISESIKKRIQEWEYVDYKKISDPIPNGVDPELFSPSKKKPRDQFTVGYIGRLSPEKGLDVLQEVIRLCPDIRFKIIGRQQMDLNLPENVDYQDHIKYTEIPYSYGELDAVILTSHTEGFTNLLPETYSMEIPLITHRDIYPSEIPEYGIVVKRNNPKLYRRAIQSIKQGHYHKYDVRNYVKKNLSWEQYGKRTVELFRKLLEEKK